VNVAPNRGATVANLSIEEAIDILYARQALEGAAASLAAERISDEQLDKLEELIGRMKAALDEKKFDLYSEINVEFHGIIYDACGSKKIPDIISSLRARVVRLQFRTILLPGRNEQSFNEHKGIYEALRKRSPEEAEAAMKKHFESLRRALNDPYFSYMT
jgi:DNA-binding GntR family transcriptional regulator